MSGRKPIPPQNCGPRDLVGPRILGYSVGSWSRHPASVQAPAEAVALTLDVDFGGSVGEAQMVVRLKSRAEVERLVTLLGQYAHEVWPEKSS